MCSSDLSCQRCGPKPSPMSKRLVVCSAAAPLPGHTPVSVFRAATRSAVRASRASSGLSGWTTVIATGYGINMVPSEARPSTYERPSAGVMNRPRTPTVPVRVGRRDVLKVATRSAPFEDVVLVAGADRCKAILVLANAPQMALETPPLVPDTSFSNDPTVYTFSSNYAGDWQSAEEAPAFPMATSWHAQSNQDCIALHERSCASEAARQYRYQSPTPNAGWHNQIVEVLSGSQPFIPPVMSDPTGLLTVLSTVRKGIVGVPGTHLSHIALRHGWLNESPNDPGPHHMGAFDYVWTNNFTEGTGIPFPFYAIADGTVVYVGSNLSAGNVLIVEHPTGGPLGVPIRSIHHHIVRDPMSDYALAVRTMGYCDTEKRACRRSWPCYNSFRNDPWSFYEKYKKEVVDAQNALLNGNPLPPKWGNVNTGLRVRVGDRVFRGQQLGFTGDTGTGSGGVHLHFAVAAQVTGAIRRGTQHRQRWWTFDPYGLYARPEYYAGLYPSGPVNDEIRHPSLYAPVMPDHALVPVRVELLASEYYRRLGWSQTTLCIAEQPCTEQPLFAGSYAPGLRPAMIWADLPSMTMEARHQARQGWSVSSIKGTARTAAHGRGQFAATWESSFGRRTIFWPVVPWSQDLTGWIRTAANAGPDLRILDACPYFEGGVLRVAASVEIHPVFSLLDYRITVGVESATIWETLNQLALQGRMVTRLHHYFDGAVPRCLLVHRRLWGHAEEWTFHTARNRGALFVEAAARRGEGFSCLFMDVLTFGLGEVYYYAFVRNRLPL